MKQRNGFVSNSSSSSFIVGIAKISDRNMFDKKFKWQTGDGYSDGFQIRTLKQIMDGESYWTVGVSDTHISVEGITNSVSIPREGLSENDEILVFSRYGGEGDHSFDPMGTGDIDYDIDFGFFSEDEQNIIRFFEAKNKGLENPSVAWGAGRDG